MLINRTVSIFDTPFEKKAIVYKDSETACKGSILYFHGGGFLYGQKEDLPDLHLTTLTKAGFAVISFDYPLAPAADIDQILSDVCQSISHYIDHSELYVDKPLPYFLWGRSAGAYLCLLAGAKATFKEAPKGILSYYGYGFLCDLWFEQPAPYYCTLPRVDVSILQTLPQELHANGALDTHYSAYVYARQSGQWISQFYHGKSKDFLLNYSLRTSSQMPCPLFCAHSTNDPDVPYEEFTKLCDLYQAKRFVASEKAHDFDRNENSFFTKLLLKDTIGFLTESL
ncbi:alpha/beta hydrolase fold domain-containing protein [Anaerostipes sp. MSJ-23]|uniref:alpha/beta hydrolase fold domain-containing protein n=1 Tax=Anaerostipes sp. MSJ-23 TaxID=2841520 RepID=UPI001C0FDA43|nr:alpha/beta hydrolase [Anaerostipes sp. MSJ-23]MBU5459180.1 alpha/beta hydrolase [Anaerostipes sp. MSJ-23]